MKWLSSAGVLLLAVSLPVVAKDDMATLSNGELCVRHDISLILGASFDGNSEPEQATELARRGEACEPSGFYLQIAGKRLDAARDVIARQQGTAYQEPPPPPSPDWGQRVQRAATRYLEIEQQQQQQRQQMIQAQRPITTTCRESIVGMECTSR